MVPPGEEGVAPGENEARSALGAPGEEGVSPGEEGVAPGEAGAARHVVNAKQSKSSGQSFGPRGQGCSHEASASFLFFPQKKVDEITLGVSGSTVGAVSFLQVVNGMHDSSGGHSRDVPFGQGTRHFSLASA